MADKMVTLLVTSAVVVDGEIKAPKAIITVDEETAKDLLQRGKCELYTASSEDKASKGDAKEKAPKK